MKFNDLFGVRKPILGMIHLGSKSGMTMLELAQREIDIYLRYGIYPLVENYFGSDDDVETVLHWISTAHPDVIYGLISSATITKRLNWQSGITPNSFR